MRDPVDEFVRFNRPLVRRHPELLRLKVARMAESSFAFFRGTFHLFARDVLDKATEALPALADAGPELDLVGDIHTENYGTFKATDGRIHYDINDFDETTHGRFHVDVSRLATALFLVVRRRNSSTADAVRLLLTVLDTYAAEARRLIRKRANYDVSEDLPSGAEPVDSLMTKRAAVKRIDFIRDLTEEGEGGKRRLIRSHSYFNLTDDERAQALRLLDDYKNRREPPEFDGFYEPIDVCGRVAGIGSMGRLRYVVLVVGKGKKEGRHVLIEFKEARPSAYDLFRQRDTDAAALAGRAAAVVAAQRGMQAASSPYLGFATDGGQSFQAREVGPHDGRVDFLELKSLVKVEETAGIQARVLARAHARAVADAIGPTNPLAELADPNVFQQRVLAFALAYADLVEADYRRFVGRRAELEDAATWAS